MHITEKLKSRFAKDMSIPIGVVKEPYFEERLDLYEDLYGARTKYNEFTWMLAEKFKFEQDYFEFYNSIKDKMMNDIKSSEAFQRFNNEDMNRFACEDRGSFCGKDIFHDSNNGRVFISIDMIKANFSALSLYDKSMFDNAETWDDFVLKYTDLEYIRYSKYIRQVVLGNCNPKRHITYEKYITNVLLCEILDNMHIVFPYKIVFVSNDEIVLDITEAYESNPMNYKVFIEHLIHVILNANLSGREISKFPDFRFTPFRLQKITESGGYMERSLDDGSIDLKCVNNFELPFIARKIKGEIYKESDFVFMHEGRLCKYLEAPKVLL